MIPRGAALALLLLAAPSCAAAMDEGVPVGRVEVRVELPPEPPYVGEPLRLVLRSAVRGKIAIDRIAQPSLTNFDWQQFGADASSEEMIDGFWTPVLERVLMIYPLEAGRLTIPPFTRHIAYLTPDGGRAEIELASRPVEIEVRAHDGIGDPADPWLPARSVRIVDSWEPDPDTIRFGETSRRTVTVEAEGVTADRLPALPSFRAPGVVTFAGPVERRTIVTDQGPIARAVYRWTVRPVSAASAFAPPLRLAWFDVTSRRMREAVAPERRVAYSEATRERRAREPGASAGLLSPRPLAALLASFVSTFAAVWLAVTSGAGRRRLLEAKPAALRVLRRAARVGDVAAFRRALAELAKADRDGWREIAERDDIAPALASLDAALFARNGGSPPELAPLACRIAAAWRARRSEGA